MNCIVIDDEPLAREGMKLLISEIKDLQLLGSFSNIPDAMNMLNSSNVDIVFLDIQMPLMTGLELLKLNGKLPLVVITTAYPEYALLGFEYDVVDYLAKPIHFNRFYSAVAKCRRAIAGKSELQDNAKLQTQVDTLFIRSNNKYVRVELDKISHIEALKDYVLVFYDKEKLPVAINLKAIEEKLPKNKFIRINKSYILNIDFVKSIENDLVVLEGTELTIGKSYKENLLKFISEKGLIKRDY